MIRYYVEFGKQKGVFIADSYVYVYAYSEQHVRDMFDDYELVAIDQTDKTGDDE